MQEEEQHFVARRVAQYEQLRLFFVGAKWSQQKKHLEVAAEKMKVRFRALKGMFYFKAVSLFCC